MGIYGLLAHSHEWKNKTDSEAIITNKIIQNDQDIVTHPREMIDVICVADVGTWTAKKIRGYKISGANFSDHCQFPATCYSSSSSNTEDQRSSFTPIGALISNLMQKLAYKDVKMRGLAEYFAKAVAGNSKGLMRKWDPSFIYSSEVNDKLMEVTPSLNPFSWDEWGMDF